MNPISFIPFPNLTTERLGLRQLTDEDENKILQLRSDERVSKFLTRPIYKTIEESRAFIKKINNGIDNNEWIYWALTFKNKNELIGTICIWNILWEHSRAEVGFELLPDFQGKGFMQEALTMVLDYGFNTMKLHSIEGVVSPGNLSSIKILEKNNFVREAYFKENFFHEGKFIDTAVYSLLNPDNSK